MARSRSATQPRPRSISHLGLHSRQPADTGKDDSGRKLQRQDATPTREPPIAAGPAATLTQLELSVVGRAPSQRRRRHHLSMGEGAVRGPVSSRNRPIGSRRRPGCRSRGAPRAAGPIQDPDGPAQAEARTPAAGIGNLPPATETRICDLAMAIEAPSSASAPCRLGGFRSLCTTGPDAWQRRNARSFLCESAAAPPNSQCAVLCAASTGSPTVRAGKLAPVLPWAELDATGLVHAKPPLRYSPEGRLLYETDVGGATLCRDVLDAIPVRQRPRLWPCGRGWASCCWPWRHAQPLLRGW